MYQAIVFLPLLGCIIAALITLAGARARHPGGTPAAGGEDHAAPHVPEHRHGAPALGPSAAAVPHSDAQPAEDEPPAIGSREAELVTTALLFASMVLSWIAFVYVGLGHHETRVPLFPWIVAGNLHVDWALRIDTLTAVMLVVVTTISAFVHLYSIGYMDEDRKSVV